MSSNIQLPLWCHKWWAYVGHRIYGTSREQILLKFASKKMDFSYMKAKVEVVYLSCPEVLFINHQNTATAAVDVILTWSKPLRREEKPVWWKKKKKQYWSTGHGNTNWLTDDLQVCRSFNKIEHYIKINSIYVQVCNFALKIVHITDASDGWSWTWIRKGGEIKNRPGTDY